MAEQNDVQQQAVEWGMHEHDGRVTPAAMTAAAEYMQYLHHGSNYAIQIMSRSCSSISRYAEYLYIDESTGEVGAGWYWVAERGNVHLCGWAAPRNLKRTGTYQKYHRLQMGQMYPLDHAWAIADTAPDGPSYAASSELSMRSK